MKTDQMKIYFVQLTVLSIAFVAAGCDSNTSSNKSNQAETPAQTPQANQPTGNILPSSSPSPVESSAPGDLFAVIREFGGQDNNAMFILPFQKGTKITKVEGQSFLGDAYLGQLNEKTLQGIFSKSSSPMPQQEQDDLLSKYIGSGILYFENYGGGELCSGQYTYRFTISATFQDTDYTLLFDVVSKPNPTGDCVFESVIYCSGPTGMFTCTLPER